MWDGEQRNERINGLQGKAFPIISPIPRSDVLSAVEVRCAERSRTRRGGTLSIFKMQDGVRCYAERHDSTADFRIIPAINDGVVHAAYLNLENRFLEFISDYLENDPDGFPDPPQDDLPF